MTDGDDRYTTDRHDRYAMTDTKWQMQMTDRSDRDEPQMHVTDMGDIDEMTDEMTDANDT